MYEVDGRHENTFLQSLPTSPGRDSPRGSSRHVLTDGALRPHFPQEGKLIQENVGGGEVAGLSTAFVHAGMVGLGGFVGALARYGLSGFVQRMFPMASFPYGTLAVNLLGCLLIGIMAGLMETRGLFSPEFRVFALIGVLGGFTTFSTLGIETFAMLRDTEYIRAAANVSLHVVAGLSLVWVGYTATTFAVR